MRGESSYGTATMEVVTENWERQMSMEVWSLGTEYSLIRITAPKKEQGTATLKAGDEIWNYLPRVDRTIKIPASMMMGAWMGSHFTNDDLVKESRLIEDYDIAISFDGARDGVTVWELALTPKPEAAVVWGRIEYQVRQDDWMPTWARYYDEDDHLVRTMTFTDFRVLGGRLVPAVMDVRPEDKPGERTTVRYESLEFDIGIDESFFSLRALRSGGR
jgi:outer membrane lipoprotein-sorting protein